MNKFLALIFPMWDNRKAILKLRDKLNSFDSSEEIKAEYCPLYKALEPDSVTVQAIKDMYKDEIARKSLLEDKAKTNVIGITISITLVMGAYGLSKSIYDRIPFLTVHWVLFGLLIVTALYMIFAGIISVKNLVDENVVFIIADEHLALDEQLIKVEYDKCIGKNRIQNIIRNNNIYTSYECIRNALVCLFAVLLISTLPLRFENADTMNNMMENSEFYYSYNATWYLADANSAQEIEVAVKAFLAGKDDIEDGTYGFIDESRGLFIKFTLSEHIINITFIEPYEMIN